METINVCGALVYVQPDYKQEVSEQLEQEEGVEVHAVTETGRLVVTIEKDDQQQTGDMLNQIQSMDHVISTSMVYQYFDQEPADQWEMAS